MPTAVECVLCQNTSRGATSFERRNSTQHCVVIYDGPHWDEFSMSETRWTSVAWVGYRQQYKGRAFDGPQDQKYRHIAYKQFVRWCWEFLGKDNRHVLPACTVCCVRAHYPPPGNEETATFKGFRVVERDLEELH